MIPSRQARQEQKSIRLKHRSRRAFGLETPMRHRLMKQRARLLRMREDLAKEVQRLRGEACEETPNYSMHMADAATDSFDRDLVLGLVSFEQEGLYEIDAALKRIEDGTYGVCELTGKAIPWERLEAIPWTRFSIEAENQIEGNVHPHIGLIGRVRMGETELSGAGPNGLADDEVDSPVDLDHPSIRREIRFRAPTGSDDDQPIDEQIRGVGHRKRGALRGFWNGSEFGTKYDHFRLTNGKQLEIACYKFN